MKEIWGCCYFGFTRKRQELWLVKRSTDLRKRRERRFHKAGGKWRSVDRRLGDSDKGKTQKSVENDVFTLPVSGAGMGGSFVHRRRDCFVVSARTLGGWEVRSPSGLLPELRQRAVALACCSGDAFYNIGYFCGGQSNHSLDSMSAEYGMEKPICEAVFGPSIGWLLKSSTSEALFEAYNPEREWSSKRGDGAGGCRIKLRIGRFRFANEAVEVLVRNQQARNYQGLGARSITSNGSQPVEDSPRVWVGCTVAHG
ncbi:hypothetical protein QBC36DRAFT_48995 [Triangularia setosa]|uniref:Uncharacterized protein n=1 Tax=Triangularia setosa TaxID=2587417 RepID=A0AAN6W234_9PEZI|nr:hypothetical protein QBC36DRAFT_48995 [Podospora setosa]